MSPGELPRYTLSQGRLYGNHDNALPYPLAVPPHYVSIHLEDRASPKHFSGLYILKCIITTRDTTCTADNCPEIPSGRENHLFEQILCLSITGNLPLAIGMNPNSVIFFG